MGNEDKPNEHGSQKNLLNWVESGKFLDELNKQLEPTGAVVAEDDHWCPTGWTGEQWREMQLPAFGDEYLPEHKSDWSNIREWWLIHGDRGPQWDLISTCTIEGKPGLVLIEAKAHENECHLQGKEIKYRYKDDKKVDRIIKPESIKNHIHIGAAIDSARHWLNRIPYDESGFPTNIQSQQCKISRDTHYQLCNRIAFTWKLASQGWPVVLLYLGFTGDTHFPNDHFQDEEHWQSHFSDYADPVLPERFRERRIDLESGYFWIICRSLPMLSVNPIRNDSP